MKETVDSLLNWEKPLVTGLVLGAIDLAIIFLMYMSSNICSFVLLLVLGHFAMSKAEWFKKQDETGFKQNLYSTIIYLVYDNLNKAFDNSRRLMYLEDPFSLICTVLLCFFFALIGRYFSSLLIILIALNIYVLLNYGGIKQKIADAYNKVAKIVSDNADKFIPKYVEGKDVPKY